MNVSVSTTSVPCSGWTVRGQNCSFELRTVSQDCGFTSGPVNEYVVLMGKQPINISIKLLYYVCMYVAICSATCTNTTIGGV